MEEFKKNIALLKNRIYISHDLFKTTPSHLFFKKKDDSSWSSIQILGHLIDSCANNHQRIVRSFLTSSPTFSVYQQDDWVRVQNYQMFETEVIIDLWKNYNLHLIHILSQVKSEDLDVKIEFIEGQHLSIRQLATDYAEHMEHHINQINQLIN